MLSNGANLNTWVKLVPDSRGSYANGTWQTLASSPYGMGAAQEHIVTHLSCGTDSDFDAIVGGFQIVAGLRCKRCTGNYCQSCCQQDARSHAASSPRKKKFKTRRTYVARS